jgi:hypothetical protein
MANGVFGWHLNTSPMRRFYQSRIERVFHQVPGSFTPLGFVDQPHEQLGQREVPQAGAAFHHTTPNFLLRRDVTPGCDGVEPEG